MRLYPLHFTMTVNGGVKEWIIVWACPIVSPRRTQRKPFKFSVYSVFCVVRRNMPILLASPGCDALFKAGMI